MATTGTPFGLAALALLISLPSPAGEHPDPPKVWEPSAAEVEMCSALRCVVVPAELLELKIRLAAQALIEAHRESDDPSRCWEQPL